MEFTFFEMMKILDESTSIEQAKQKLVTLNQRKKKNIDIEIDEFYSNEFDEFNDELPYDDII